MNNLRYAATHGDLCSEKDLILKCRGGKAGSSTDETIRYLIRRGLDWSYVLRTAAQHGVIPQLYTSIRSTAADLVDTSVLSRLRTTFQKWGLLVHVRARELLRLDEKFSACGVDVISFKGPVLGADVYGDSVLRKPGDLDLLVHRDQFGQAREVLVNAGYEPTVSSDEEVEYLRRNQGYPFRGETCNVDLHWTLEHPSFGDMPHVFSVADDEIWCQKRTVDLLGRPIDTLATEHLVLYLAAHGAKHSWKRLYLICDIAGLLERSDVAWHEVVRLARDQRMERFFLLACILAHDLLDADVPSSLENVIDGDPAARELAEQVAEWLFDPSRQNNRVEHSVFRLRMLDNLQDRMKYLWFRGIRRLENLGSFEGIGR